MARQVMELVCWIEGEDFPEAFAAASEPSRQRFKVAVRTLADTTDALEQK